MKSLPPLPKAPPRNRLNGQRSTSKVERSKLDVERWTFLGGFRGSMREVSLRRILSELALLFALAGLASGCAAPSGSSSAPKPGKGIAEYRQVVQEAHGSVAATVKALEVLA